MKYSVEYQYQPRGSARPHDDGEIVGIAFDDRGQGLGTALIPNVGDFVALHGHGVEAIQAQVKTRFFRYIQAGDGGEWYCHVNIVVTDTDQDWGQLIKE